VTGEYVTEPYPPAILIAVELFLQRHRELRWRKISAEQQLFANQAWRRRVGGQVIAKLLEQQGAQHWRRHQIIGTDNEPQWDAATRRWRLIGLGLLCGMCDYCSHPTPSLSRSNRCGSGGRTRKLR
jgi:hypothetical protein